MAGVLLVFAGVLFLSGCLPVENPHAHSSSAGFFMGLWHGFICPFTLILSLFNDTGFYEVNNTGWWYNFGFLLGAGSILGGGGRASRKRH